MNKASSDGERIMPNGGVPLHMILYPHDGDVVIYCRGAEVRVIPRMAWQQDKAAANPLCTLNDAESDALLRHLRYWLGEASGPRLRAKDVNVEYDC
jgi:hypothetical protein